MNKVTTHSDKMSILAQADAKALKALIERLLPTLGPVDVLRNRTGLTMLPYTDTVKGTVFHIGEVLIAEAYVRIAGHDGYGAVMGRDLEQALAVAIADAILRGDHFATECKLITAYVDSQAQVLTDADEQLLKQVESTRVEMETF